MKISKRKAHLIRLGIRLSRNPDRPPLDIILGAAHPVVRHTFLQRLNRDALHTRKH